MARFAIKALVVTALVCLVLDLAASDDSHQHHEQNEQNVHNHHEQNLHQQTADKDVAETTPTPSTFKEKFKGFVGTVKEGASDALEKLDEKRKEAVAGTKKLIGQIKDKYDSFRHGDANSSSGSDEPRSPESSEEHVKSGNKDKDAAADKFNPYKKPAEK